MPFAALIGIAVAAIILGYIFLFRSRIARRQATNLSSPPGPFQWPLIGCLPSFPFHHRHRKFLELSSKYGPIVAMPIGSSHIFLVHGKDLAMEVLRSKDGQFSSRPLSMTGHYIGFEHSDPNLCPLNENWKVVRKAFSNELMAPSRLNAQAWLRREEVVAMVESIRSNGKEWCDVEVRKVAEGVVGRIIMRMLFGDHYRNKTIDRDPDVVSISQELDKHFEAYLTEGNFLWGELNLTDYFPRLGIFDLQGLEARFKKLMSKLEPLFTKIIHEHRKNPPEVDRDDGSNKDVIDVLLQNHLSDKQIMGILSDALLPGISTTAAAVEWAMAELAANPHTLQRAQQELDNTVGRSRLMDEADVPSLPYLQSIAKEVLRLHPSAPLDDPHLNPEASSLGGYAIPANSTIFVNLWALGRDGSLWSDPESFKPDRFLGSDIGVHGSHFELIPFSSGRRRCPAHALAITKLHHIVGSLAHGFEWTSCREAAAIDLIEGDGIVASPRTPLRLRARPRLEDEAYLCV